ncbi:hypothetical protein CASFOL_034081 [Castilleja foliolosa]|uniref:6-phosphogluconate dehydrogenase NADP-binding domain-containing protein n=1 Tax=Castilleja foliolosa TaxID=1961234 RepID=A0ABD3BWJ3_9LAMI
MAAITSKGASFLEAPVSGRKKPAEDGQLVILAAGEKPLYEAVLPAFDILGKKFFFLGQVGNGAKMKLGVNMIYGQYDECILGGACVGRKEWAELSNSSRRAGSRCYCKSDVQNEGAVYDWE